MSKNLIWSAEDLKKKGLVQNQSGDYVPVKSLVNTGKVEKLPNLLERALEQRSQMVKPAANKKVRNATKSVVDGVSFDSNLEKYLYFELKSAGINFEFQKTFILQPSFRYRGKAIIAMKSICDFWISDHNLILDAKGYANETSPLKYKLLKYKFYKAYESGARKREPPEIIMPKNRKECDEVVARIKAGEFL